MGYASLDQKGTGLRQRIFSRAFIIGNVNKPSERFVYINLDTACGDTAIRDGIVTKLGQLYPGIYTEKNKAVVGTHSHSGLGAWVNYLLPQITTLGFDKQSYSAIVDGAVNNVVRAHNSAAPGFLALGKTYVEGVNVNRSPYAYEANPAAERASHAAEGGETDKVMIVLTFRKADGAPIGLLNWFPVHGTSLYNNNTLVTGDNKGLVALLLEKDIGNGFVAGFSQENVGDTSPNTVGPVCQDTGLPCKYEHSTCNCKSQQCMGRGPAFQISDAESNRIIATKQYEAAKTVFRSSEQTPVGGDGGIVRSYHTFVDFGAGYKFELADGAEKITCKAALGFSFAAGTTGRPGAFGFTQNDPRAPKNQLWLAVRALLKQPSQEQIECQKPKPILLAVGEMSEPYQWSANIVDLQMFRVGQLVAIVSPGEASTMAGRRWKKAVVEEMDKLGIIPKSESWAVIGGPANTYTHYIVSPEEYAIQRYEGASTLYGQWTLDAYISLSKKYAPYLAETPPPSPMPSGPKPPINTNKSLSFITGVVMDNPPPGKKFGQVLADAQSSYLKGQAAKAEFIGANPRNNLRFDKIFAAVEKKDGSSWRQVRDDTDYDLVYQWTRTEGLTGQSKVAILWKVESTAETGTYRIKYYGDSKPLIGQIKAFEGVSREFTVA